VTSSIGGGGAGGGEDADSSDGEGSSFSQSGRGTLISTEGGKKGKKGVNGGKYEEVTFRCGWLGCWPEYITIYNEGNGGDGGAGGNDGGNAGTAGQGGKRSYEARGSSPLGRGGAGGASGGGAGGKGGDARNESNATGSGAGKPGSVSWSYTRRELFGPAIVVRHTNVRFYNEEGIIAGGYSNPVRYAFYGSQNVENTIGGIIVPSSPGISLTSI
jgi:hypothetical protein